MIEDFLAKMDRESHKGYEILNQEEEDSKDEQERDFYYDNIQFFQDINNHAITLIIAMNIINSDNGIIFGLKILKILISMDIEIFSKTVKNHFIFETIIEKVENAKFILVRKIYKILIILFDPRDYELSLTMILNEDFLNLVLLFMDIDHECTLEIFTKFLIFMEIYSFELSLDLILESSMGLDFI